MTINTGTMLDKHIVWFYLLCLTPSTVTYWMVQRGEPFPSRKHGRINRDSYVEAPVGSAEHRAACPVSEGMQAPYLKHAPTRHIWQVKNDCVIVGSLSPWCMLVPGTTEAKHYGYHPSTIGLKVLSEFQSILIIEEKMASCFAKQLIYSLYRTTEELDFAAIILCWMERMLGGAI